MSCYEVWIFYSELINTHMTRRSSTGSLGRMHYNGELRVLNPVLYNLEIQANEKHWVSLQTSNGKRYAVVNWFKREREKECVCVRKREKSQKVPIVVVAAAFSLYTMCVPRVTATFLQIFIPGVKRSWSLHHVYFPPFSFEDAWGLTDLYSCWLRLTIGWGNITNPHRESECCTYATITDERERNE